MNDRPRLTILDAGLGSRNHLMADTVESGLHRKAYGESSDRPGETDRNNSGAAPRPYSANPPTWPSLNTLRTCPPTACERGEIVFLDRLTQVRPPGTVAGGIRCQASSAWSILPS